MTAGDIRPGDMYRLMNFGAPMAFVISTEKSKTHHDNVIVTVMALVYGKLRFMNICYASSTMISSLVKLSV